MAAAALAAAAFAAAEAEPIAAAAQAARRGGRARRGRPSAAAAAAAEAARAPEAERRRRAAAAAEVEPVAEPEPVAPIAAERPPGRCRHAADLAAAGAVPRCRRRPCAAAPDEPPPPAAAPWLTVAPARTLRSAVARRAALGPPAPTGRRDMPTTLAGRPLVPQDRRRPALWAASAREVLTGRRPGRQPRPPSRRSRAQPCVSCGLSLSANARFCRRCGTRQG